MFEVFCPQHGSKVLLTTGQIEALDNTPTGVVVTWRCWCGATGQLHRGETVPTSAAPAARQPDDQQLRPLPASA